MITRCHLAEELRMLGNQVRREGKIILFKFTYFKSCSVPVTAFYYIPETAASSLPNVSLPGKTSCRSMKAGFSLFSREMKFNKYCIDQKTVGKQLLSLQDFLSYVRYVAGKQSCCCFFNTLLLALISTIDVLFV